MRVPFKIFFASISLSSLVACSAGESGTTPPETIPDVVQDTGVDAGASDQDDAATAPPGTPCVVAAECPTFVCAKCPAAALQECTGDHVCATEEQVCASITCDDEPDAS